MRYLAMLMAVAAMLWLACCGGESDTPGKVDLSEGASGDETGQYLDGEPEVVVIHGDDDQSYVFDSPDLQNGTLVADGKEIDISEFLDDPTCQDPNAQADVIIVDGEVVDVICSLPPEAVGGDLNYVTVGGEGGDLSIPQNDNNKVIIFDPSTNGVPIVGDLTIDSNNPAIYGNGMDNTIIDGNVTLDGNNPVLRGVTITGDLHIVKNNAAVLFCRVLGNVYVEQNNVTIAECEILGNLVFDEVSSNGAMLINDLVAGEWGIEGSGHVCSGNQAFTDADANQAFTPGEEGEPLSCDNGNAGDTETDTGGNGKPPKD